MKRADLEKRCGSLVKTETDCALKVLKRNVLLYPKKKNGKQVSKPRSTYAKRRRKEVSIYKF